MNTWRRLSALRLSAAGSKGPRNPGILSTRESPSRLTPVNSAQVPKAGVAVAPDFVTLTR